MSEAVATAYWRAVQTALATHGFDPGEITGSRTAATDGALVRFKARHGLRARPYIGPLTEARLWAAPVQDGGVWPSWLRVAWQYLGLKEIPGVVHHPQIVAWWADIGAGWFQDDETPWCGAFLGGTLLEAGVSILPGALAPRARAWERWGQPLVGPAVGAVVTFWRGSPASANGHVAFVLGQRDGRLVCLGGNQNDAVTVANFDLKRVTSYRWPDGKTLPLAQRFDQLPQIESAGHRSVSEA